FGADLDGSRRALGREAGARVFEADADLDRALDGATEGRRADVVMLTAGGAAAPPPARAPPPPRRPPPRLPGGARRGRPPPPPPPERAVPPRSHALRPLLFVARRARRGLRAPAPRSGHRRGTHHPSPAPRRAGPRRGADAAARGGEGVHPAMRAQVFYGPGDL